VRFEALTAVLLKIQVVWDAMLCWGEQLLMFQRITMPWYWGAIWKHYDILQHWELFTLRHNSTSQKTWILICFIVCLNYSF